MHYIAFYRGFRQAKVLGSLADAGGVVLAPCSYSSAICLHRTAKRLLAPVSLARSSQGGLSGLPARLSALTDAIAFHLCYLCEHSNDKLPYTLANQPKAAHVYLYPLVQ
ncbi:hypothetical protein CBM2609_A110003 [Cupriavidus taiwanensis]|nr:hypothetical protein CBM2609_A110003 [Cupriavidus taiwanensis]SOZ43815.1 hypothetical protein CBM2610_A110003 [Cupriavidus taiwanensis]